MEEGAEETVSGSGEDGANVDAGEAAPLRAEEERECPLGKQKNPAEEGAQAGLHGWLKPCFCWLHLYACSTSFLQTRLGLHKGSA